MYAIVKKLRKIIFNHRYRSQIESRVATVFDRNSVEYKKIMFTVDMVAETHDNGRRRNGELLKSHEFGMFSIAFVHLEIRNLSILLSILLHDMHEDYPEIWSLEMIADIYGTEIADIVFAVSKPDEFEFDSVDEYDLAIFKKVISGGAMAVLVKCIDRLHNMLTLYGNKEKQSAKVYQTIMYVLPMSAEYKFLTYELSLATAEQMYRLRLHHVPGI